MKGKVLTLILVLVLTSCTRQQPAPTQSMPLPTDTRTPVATVSSKMPTRTPPRPTASATPTLAPLPTMQPEVAQAWLEQWDNAPITCYAPCFLGIIPGIITIDEVKLMFGQFGSTAWMFEDDASINFDFMSSTGEIVQSLTLSKQGDLITGIESRVKPHKQIVSPQLSLNELIRLYGKPDDISVKLMLGQAKYNRFHFQINYYVNHTTIEYVIEDTNGEDLKPFCPLEQTYDYYFFHSGRERKRLLSTGVQIEKISTVTTSKIIDLLINDPENACIDINIEELLRLQMSGG